MVLIWNRFSKICYSEDLQNNDMFKCEVCREEFVDKKILKIHVESEKNSTIMWNWPQWSIVRKNQQKSFRLWFEPKESDKSEKEVLRQVAK